MEKIEKNDFSEKVLRIIKGSAIAVILTLVLLLLFAVILTYSSVQENVIKPVIIVISGISILFGSSISTLKIKKNGILNGGIVGLIYILVLYLLSSTSGAGFSFNMYSIIMIFVSILMGAIGGIVGVNLK